MAVTVIVEVRRGSAGPSLDDAQAAKILREGREPLCRDEAVVLIVAEARTTAAGDVPGRAVAEAPNSRTARHDALQLIARRGIIVSRSGAEIALCHPISGSIAGCVIGIGQGAIRAHRLGQTIEGVVLVILREKAV